MSELKTSYLAQNITEQVSKILSWSIESAQLFKVTDLVEWYLGIPNCSTFRVNTLKHTVEEVVQYLQQELKEKCNDGLEVTVHDVIPECIIVSRMNTENLDMTLKPYEVIVDTICGVAVLRGSNIFAPGVLSMTPKTKIKSKVSVFADLSANCLRGSKRYSHAEKLFLGNGLALQNRFDIFESGKKLGGVAVEMTDPISGLTMPPYSCHLGVLQNLPSMVCVRVLNPQPKETILDMCAAPGNKTTHIASLMNDEGILIALDRKSKIKYVTESCSKLGINNCVHVFAADSTKIVGELCRPVTEGPPFSPATFDRILLDAACSGSGNRPMLKNLLLTEKTTRSFSKMQKSFIANAVQLLKPGGTLVYSTCSILCEENECVIAWALENYPQMELIEAAPVVGSPGLPNCNLSAKQRSFVQRFGPGTLSNESIGFFIAALRKNK